MEVMPFLGRALKGKGKTLSILPSVWLQYECEGDSFWTMWVQGWQDYTLEG